MAALYVVAFTFLTVTLLRGGFSVTDEELRTIDPTVAKVIGELNEKIGKLEGRLQKEVQRNKEIEEEIRQLKGGLQKETKRNEDMEEIVKIQNLEIRTLSDIVTRSGKWKPEVMDLMQNNTIEERVSLLEVQVADLREDVTEVDEDVRGLDADVNILFEEQIIQDERLLELEQTSDAVVVELALINENIQDIETTILTLDFRVAALEENGGDDGNSSVAELEVRVETLEETAADHETRLTTAEVDIEVLQITDLNHEARISALEENGGGFQNDTIAFHSALTSYNTIPGESAVIFNEIILNDGNGYDNTTGVFTVPPSGDGVYYFSTYVLVEPGESAGFDMRLNNDVICTILPDHDSSGDSDYVPSSCSAVVNVVEGDGVMLVLRGSTDNDPLFVTTSELYNGFNGFKI